MPSPPPETVPNRNPAQSPDPRTPPGTAIAVSAARRQGLMIGIATGAYGVSFGALGVAAGLSFWQVMVLSLVMFTGGSQFAFVGAIAGGPLGAVASSVLLGIRNMLYGMSLTTVLDVHGLRRPAAALLTIDESSANAAGQEAPEAKRAGFWSAGIWVYVLWNLMTAVGAAAGNLLGDPSRWGLDAAAAAAFLGLLWPRLVGARLVGIAAGSAAVTLVLTPFLPSGLPVLAGVVVAVVAGWRTPADPGRPSRRSPRPSDARRADGSAS